MKDDKNNAKLFVHGYLTQITDANGNITAFVIMGKIMRPVRPAGIRRKAAIS